MIKKIDFVIVILIITAVIMMFDNLYLGDGLFNSTQIHHESFIIALIFGAFVLYIFRNRLV